MRVKRCTMCHRLLPLDDFYDDKTKKSGKRSRCKKCFNRALIEARKTKPHCRRSYLRNKKKYAERHRDKIREKDRKWYWERGGRQKKREWFEKNMHKVREGVKRSQRKNPHKVAARRAVHKALRKGILKKPERCEVCGKKTKNLDGHHYKGYEPENWLSVQWICEKCHGKTERKS